jgi:N-acetylglucosaminyldiphosphoundecaprenol N-acetyl-beta-D-mannosaminyltransferase
MAIEAHVPALSRDRLHASVVELRRRRVDIGGVLIDQIGREMAIERIRGFLSSGSAHQVVTVNLDFVHLAERQPAFRDAVNRADLAVADGMPLVWLSRLRGQPLEARITGHELVAESCRLAAETGHGVFLLGAAPGVAEAAARELQARYAGLKVAGTYSPPFAPLTSDGDARIVAMVRDAAPGFLFVALGPPRQDLWIREHLEELDVPVCIGVGCVFDILAGNVRRAPRWSQQAGLEWAYRLVQEPGRLWKRYLLNDMPLFGRLVIDELLAPGGGLRVDPRAASEPVG